MRKFQYLVTLNMDDDHFLSDEEMVAQIKKLDGIDGPDIIYALADARFPAAIQDQLARNLGDCGKSTVSVIFAGEDK